MHLTQEHVELLFGQGHQLTPHSGLSQPGQFACQDFRVALDLGKLVIGELSPFLLQLAFNFVPAAF